MIDYKIISTGSTGNAVLINGEILIDCGVPFVHLNPHISSLKLVLLTHQHADHFNPATVKKLHSERPTLRFLACKWMLKPLVDAGVSTRNIDILECDKVCSYGINYKICPVALVHNVPNCGYKIGLNSEKMFYATDTNSLSHISAKSYNLYLIEGNYGEYEIAERIKAKTQIGGYIYEKNVIHNHLSREKATVWIANNAGENSVYQFIHGHGDRYPPSLG